MSNDLDPRLVAELGHKRETKPARLTHEQIMERRELTARMSLRGMTVRTIAAELVKKGIASSHSTVARDLEALRADWRAARAAELDTHRDRVFMELREVKRLAWGQEDARAILAALKQEAELLGVNAPTKHAVTWEDAARAEGHDPAEVRRKIAAVLDAAEASDGDA